MTTFNDDYIQLELATGTRRLACTTVGLTWPPPEKLWLDEHGLRIANADDNEAEVLVRTSMSIITDEERAGMDRIMRGALYQYPV